MMKVGPANQRILILSDTHLGWPNRGGRSAEALRPLWRGAHTLIVNGDIAEIHDPARRVQAAREVVKIQNYCDQDGVELRLLSGNHDSMISDIRQLTLCDGAVFVTHGDVLHPAISPWNNYRGQLQQLNETALDALAPADRESFDGQAAAVQFASHQKWDDLSRKQDQKTGAVMRIIELAVKAARVAWYWRTLPRRAVRFAKTHAPEARFFIFGHIHRAGVWRFGSRVVINTGSYDFPSRPHAVVIENNQLAVWPIERDGERFRLASKPRACFDLPQPSDRAENSPRHGVSPDVQHQSASRSATS